MVAWTRINVFFTRNGHHIRMWDGGGGVQNSVRDVLFCECAGYCVCVEHYIFFII